VTTVVGIDPSLSATGLAWGDGSTSTVKYPKDVKGDVRLCVIAEAVEDLTRLPMTGHAVNLAVIEDLPTHAHGAGITGMVQGIIRLQLIRDGIPYVTVPAATLKKYATGKGNATKPDMRMELFQRTGIDLRDDNQVDAAWLRFLGLALIGKPEIQLPKTHTVALDKLALPEGLVAV
jgi:Holliday junction resolvasome RuvABC endonuclease subunit